MLPVLPIPAGHHLCACPCQTVACYNAAKPDAWLAPRSRLQGAVQCCGEGMSHCNRAPELFGTHLCTRACAGDSSMCADKAVPGVELRLPWCRTWTLRTLKPGRRM